MLMFPKMATSFANYTTHTYSVVSNGQSNVLLNPENLVRHKSSGGWSLLSRKCVQHWCDLSSIYKALNPGLQILGKILRFYIFNFIHMLGSILIFLYPIYKLWSALHCSNKWETWRWRVIYRRPHLDKKFLFSRFSGLKEDEGRMLG